MSIGWFEDIDDADEYFETERLETDAWDALVESTFAQKTKVLWQAYNRLYYDKRWELPTHMEASEVELVKLKKANGEMAYYLIVHLADEDRRKGIQVQGVTAAGIVKETYSEKELNNLPVPPFVEALLADWKIESHFGAVDLARDEGESVKTKVHKF